MFLHASTWLPTIGQLHPNLLSDRCNAESPHIISRSDRNLIARNLLSAIHRLSLGKSMRRHRRKIVWLLFRLLNSTLPACCALPDFLSITFPHSNDRSLQKLFHPVFVHLYVSGSGGQWRDGVLVFFQGQSLNTLPAASCHAENDK